MGECQEQASRLRPEQRARRSMSVGIVTCSWHPLLAKEGEREILAHPVAGRRIRSEKKKGLFHLVQIQPAVNHGPTPFPRANLQICTD